MHYKSTQLELSHEGISDYRGNQLVTKNGKIQHVLIIFSVKKSPNGKVNPPIGSLCAMSLCARPPLQIIKIIGRASSTRRRTKRRCCTAADTFLFILNAL
jgi:hypothetical protein